jgi:hypothetical protein
LSPSLISLILSDLVKHDFLSLFLCNVTTGFSDNGLRVGSPTAAGMGAGSATMVYLGAQQRQGVVSRLDSGLKNRSAGGSWVFFVFNLFPEAGTMFASGKND